MFSDTRISGKLAGETKVSRWPLGSIVLVTAGPMSGVRGSLTERRQDGKVLINLGAGVFVEIHQFWLEPTVGDGSKCRDA